MYESDLFIVVDRKDWRGEGVICLYRRRVGTVESFRHLTPLEAEVTGPAALMANMSIGNTDWEDWAEEDDGSRRELHIDNRYWERSSGAGETGETGFTRNRRFQTQSVQPAPFPLPPVDEIQSDRLSRRLPLAVYRTVDTNTDELVKLGNERCCRNRKDDHPALLPAPTDFAGHHLHAVIRYHEAKAEPLFETHLFIVVDREDWRREGVVVVDLEALGTVESYRLINALDAGTAQHIITLETSHGWQGGDWRGTVERELHIDRSFWETCFSDGATSYTSFGRQNVLGLPVSS